ncbi:hypothetical protein [Kribbella speibonae]|uniref:hypothetical protein n=1 Tax=Kribbella speibonae TaxID=1572660 RepID=UPI0013F3DDD9|nr:hypothetical protein [Kribbella speibonae]
MIDHAKAAEGLLEQITIDPNDPEFILAVAQVHALLAIAAQVDVVSWAVQSRG